VVKACLLRDGSHLVLCVDAPALELGEEEREGEGTPYAYSVKITESGQILTERLADPPVDAFEERHQPVIIEDKAYIFGGASPHGELYIYDTVLDEWETREYIAPPRDDPEFDYSGYEYENGGFKYEGLYTWQLPFSGRDYALCVGLGGKLLVIGGGDQACNPMVGALSIYDPETETWRVGDPSPSDCDDTTPCAVVGDTLYVNMGTEYAASFSFSGQGDMKGEWRSMNGPCIPYDEEGGYNNGVAQVFERLIVTTYATRVAVYDTVSGETSVHLGSVSGFEPKENLLLNQLASGTGRSLLLSYVEYDSSPQSSHVCTVEPGLVYPDTDML
ncbi:hypothetical protein KIPB_009570, partial [Kipferlia bialata]